MKTLPEPCESDVYIVGLDLPDRPERPIEEYDFQLIQPALRLVLPDASLAKLRQLDHNGHQRLFDHALEVMRRHVGGAMRWNREHGILTFVSPFIVPLQNAVGRLLSRYDLRNPVYFVEKLNEAIAGELEHNPNVVEAEGGWERATAAAPRIPAHIQMTTDDGAMVAPPAVNPRSTEFPPKWMAPDRATMADVE